MGWQRNKNEDRNTMKSEPKVTILIHEHSHYDDVSHPFIWYLAECWKQMGIGIEVLKGIPRSMPETDLLIAHVDLTVTPPDYVEFINRFPHVINGGITDISKRRISRNLVSRGDRYSGQVVVKTDMNYGGVPELINDSLSGRGNMLVTDIQRPWRKVDHLDPEKYPIFENIRAVPEGVWRNPHLVVEKFLPEIDGEFFCNRVALIMGENVRCGRAYSRSPIVKGASIVRSDPIDTPAEFRRIREHYAIDYGKIDYVVHDGEIHVFDVNKTPGGLADSEINMRLGAKLADGILPFLENLRPGV